jgi:hypothetical protein
MEVHFSPEIEKNLNELAATTCPPADQLVQIAVTAFVDDLTAAREMLDSRYDDIKRSVHICRPPSFTLTPTAAIPNHCNFGALEA